MSSAFLAPLSLSMSRNAGQRGSSPTSLIITQKAIKLTFHRYLPTRNISFSRSCLFCFSSLSLFQAFRQWGAVRSKKECEKIKAREGERCSRTSLPSPPLLFIAFFTSHRSPPSERLEQATIPSAEKSESSLGKISLSK